MEDKVEEILNIIIGEFYPDTDAPTVPIYKITMFLEEKLQSGDLPQEVRDLLNENDTLENQAKLFVHELIDLKRMKINADRRLSVNDLDGYG